MLTEVRTAFVSSLTIVFCLTIPATFGLILLAEPIMAVIFEHGAFTSADTSATATALSLYATGLFAYSANKVIVPVFYAVNAARYPVIASFLAIAMNILIITFTIEQFQHKAIAFSTSATMVINFLFLMTILYFKIGGYSVKQLVAGLVKIIAAGLVMCAFLIISYRYLGDLFQADFLVQCGTLAGFIVGGALIYLLMLKVLSLPELNEISTQFRQRLKRPDGH
ncbi:MAG: hypothetical protein CR981_00700 [Proteobacteria bacterium]|nr:MAG: hypothetical protein CR981_00700 [Pseudomonadota bacterium]